MAAAEQFAEFVTDRSPRLLRTAYLLTRDWAKAEDLLQASLAKAWFAWGRIRSDPEPYVRKVLVNTYATWWRRRWNVEEPTEYLPEVADRDDHAKVEDRATLWPALGRLPKRQRAVIVMRYFEDLTEAQVAAAMGISIGTVKSQSARALAQLRLDPALSIHETWAEPATEEVTR